MTLNEDNEDLLFCAEASRLALRGGGFACHSCSARSGSPLSLLSPVLVLRCHCRRCCPSPRSGGMHSSSISIPACSLASSASSQLTSRVRNPVPLRSAADTLARRCSYTCRCATYSSSYFA